MKTLLFYSKLEKPELEDELNLLTYREIIDLLYMALNTTKTVNKISITKRQFEEHFQFAADVKRRGRKRIEE